MNTHTLFSRSWNDVTSGDRNEVVFERLNKTYGAYEIRTNYDQTLVKVFARVGLLAILVSAVLLIAGILPKPQIELPEIDNSKLLPPVFTGKTILPKKIDVPPVSPPPSNAKLAPKIVDSHDEKDDTKPIEDSPKNSIGNGSPQDTTSVDPFNTIITEGGGTEKPVDTTVYNITAIEEFPRFPGGEDERLHFLRRNLTIPQYIKEIGNMQVKVGVEFTVMKDGTLKNIALVNGGCKYPALNAEAIRVTQKMPLWEPGRQNGNPVNVRLTMPLTFTVK